MCKERSEVRISLAALAIGALLALSCAPAIAQGPPGGSPPGLGGGEPPGQVKKDAAAQTAAPAAAAPAPAAAAPAPAPAGPPGQAKSAQTPGHLKQAARSAAAASTRPAATPVAAAPTPVAATPTAQPASTTQSAPTPAKRKRAARRAAAKRHRSSRTAARAAAPVAALIPVAAVATTTQSAPTPAPPVHRTRAAKKPVATARPKPTPAVKRITRTITRTVNDVVEVIPTWAKVAIAALVGLLLAAAVFMILGALRQRRLRRERAALLEDVGVLQEALLPVVPATVGALAVSVAYRPAAGLAAGGDFYDVFPLEHGSTGIILGDVSGHGRDALGPATFVRHMVRSYLEAGLTPRASLQLAGNVLDDQNRDEFATIVAAVYDPSAGTLSYAAAGHPPPIVTGPAAFTPLRVASSPPAGTGETTGLRQTTVALPPGSTVCFYTDGLTEARVGTGVFGRERLQFAVEELAPDATADDLVNLVGHATQQLRDDVAVCMIRPVSGAPAGTVRVEELEVTMSDLQSERLKRFFDACGVRPGDVAAARLAAAQQVGGFGSVVLRVRMADRRSGVDVVPVARATSGGTVIPVGSIR